MVKYRDEKRIAARAAAHLLVREREDKFYAEIKEKRRCVILRSGVALSVCEQTRWLLYVDTTMVHPLVCVTTVLYIRCRYDRFVVYIDYVEEARSGYVVYGVCLCAGFFITAAF